MKLLSALSTSVAVSVPPVLKALSVSTKVTSSALTSAASLVPVMLILTVDGVPSILVTLKISVKGAESVFSSSNALLAVKVH
ncbi:hypothetical protein SHVI106290_20590 [Shewanella violacea]